MIPETPDNQSLTDAASTGSSTQETVTPGFIAMGENPWTEVRDYLQSLGIEKPTDAQITKIDNWTMQQNGWR